MNIQILISTLEANQHINRLIKSLSKEMQSRNTFPMRLMQSYSGKAIEGDQLTQDYNQVLEIIRPILETTDLGDAELETIKGKKEHQYLNQAVWFARNRETDVIDLEILNQWIVAILLQKITPRIDEYIKAAEDVSLHEELGINYDDNFLVDITKDGYELRKHGLLVPGNKLVYPHQFMRRYYSANFVDFLSILAYCKAQKLDVKIRLDPLRGYCDPRFYQNLMEADHWHGEPFAESILMSKDKKEKRTFHRSDDDQTMSSYPVEYTIFRTSMMDDNLSLRQFMIEEYAPTVLQKNSINDQAHGFDKNYCIQKFAHFVYDQNEGRFIHVDGATRSFTLKDYAEIETIVAKGQDPGSKIGKRDKLFLVEGMIERDLMFSLLYEFFRYNPHLEEYFTKPVSETLDKVV